MKPTPLCSNCLAILNIYGGCDRCNKLLLKEIYEKEEEDGRERE